MRVLVTGASGFLGHHLVRFLEAHHEVAACWHSSPVEFDKARSVCLDFTDRDQCGSVLSDFAPTHIVHAGAMTQTGECEKAPEKAWKTNVEGTANLLDAAARHTPRTERPHFVFLSTDLVFNGRKPGGRYREEETSAANGPDPLMVYGRTKLAAEQLVSRTAASGALTATVLRSALIYGPPTAPRPCFLDWMIANIRRGDGTLFQDEYRSPVYVEDLCQAIVSACERKAEGVYHTGGPDRLSRYDFGLLVAELFSFPRDNVKGTSAAGTPLAALRPADVSLDITRTIRELNWRPRTCREGLQFLRRQGWYRSAKDAAPGEES